MTKKQAEALWSELREAFANTERVIIQIIQAKAWEPLGYKSFADAWKSRMAGVRLATDLARVHVVYAMFNESIPDADLIEAVGVGDEVLASLRSQFNNGVPADFAQYRVRAHLRKSPSPACRIQIELSPDELVSFRGVTDSLGLDLTAEATRVVRNHFKRLAKRAS
jgi:hypothetical protein